MITITDTWPLPFSAEVPGTYQYEFTIAGQPADTNSGSRFRLLPSYLKKRGN